MPLKYSLETFLTFLLGALILLSGFLTHILPPLPQGFSYAALFFLIFVLYALSLQPSFRRSRTDTSFRRLQFLPAFIILIWFVLSLVTVSSPERAIALSWYTWGWTLPAVLISFILLNAFCLRVVRAHAQRVSLLALLLIPFVAAAVASERYSWEEKTFTRSLIAQVGLTILPEPQDREEGIAKNLQSSDSASEESWRMKLRRMTRREERIDALKDNGDLPEVDVESTTGVLIAIDTEETMENSMGEIDDRVEPPPTLSSSGMDWSVVLLSLCALYSAVLHVRARKIFVMMT